MMHTEQSTYTSYPQLDGEESTTETLYHSYPQARPVAIEDLSLEDREILESVSGGATGGLLLFPPLSFFFAQGRGPSEADSSVYRSFRVTTVSWNAVERRVGTRRSLTRRAFRCRPLRVW